MKLNNFQRNSVFVGLVALAVGTVSLGSHAACVYVVKKREAARIADAKKRVERVMALNIAAHFTDGERARLDKCETDPEGTKKVLLEIHIDRANTWTNMAEAQQRSLERWVHTYRTSTYNDWSREVNEARDEFLKAQETLKAFMEAAWKIREHDTTAPLEPPKKDSAEKGLDQKEQGQQKAVPHA